MPVQDFIRINDAEGSMSAIYVTREGYEKMRKELDGLRAQKAELSIEIGEAMSQGDLRENAAYTYAKEKQAETLIRIGELEAKLNKVQLTDDLKVNKNEARIGATVTLKDTGSDLEMVYKLVGSEEADPLSGSISVDSPLAKAVLGKKEGDVFNAVLPRGEKKFKLAKLEYV